MDISDFIIKKDLMRGRKSIVYLATHKGTGIDVVLKKCIIENAYERTLIEKEIRIHKNLKHPRIISFHGHFFDPDDNDIVYIVLEYAKGGDLFGMMSDKIPECEFIEIILKPIVRALHYLHSRNIVHCDIKMENIFLTSYKDGAKLGDFGFAADDTYLKNQRMGTTEYLAPEILLCDREIVRDAIHNNKNLYDTPVDCWAIGVLLYEGLFGHVPWKHENGETLRQFLLKIVDNPIEMDVLIQKGASEEAARFINACLQLHPGDRMTAKDMLLHPLLDTRTESPINCHSYRDGLQNDKIVNVIRFNSERDMKKMTRDSERRLSRIEEPPKSWWCICLPKCS